MATSGGVRAGKAFVEAYLDKTKLERGLKSAESRLKSWSSSISNLSAKLFKAGTAMLSPLLASSVLLTKQAAAISDIANATGLGAAKIQEMTIGAQMLGLSAEKSVNVMFKLSDSIGKAMEGTASFVDAFGELGISMERLERMTPEERLDAVFDGLRRTTDASKKAALGMRLLGTDMKSMGDIFNMTSAEFKALTKELQEGGMFLTDEDVKKGQELTRAWIKLTAAVKGLAATLASIFQPAVLDALNLVSKMVISMKPLIEKNAELLTTIFGIAVAFLAFATVLKTVAIALSTAGSVVGFVAGFFKVLIGVIGFVASGIKALLLEFLAFVNIGGPLGILGVVAAFLSLVGVFMVFYAAVMWAIPRIGKAFNETESYVTGLKKAFSGIGSALSNTLSTVTNFIKKGDLANALKALWVGAKLTFLETIASIPLAVLSLLANTGVKALEVVELFLSGYVFLLTQMAKALYWVFDKVVWAIRTAFRGIEKSLSIVSTVVSGIWIYILAKVEVFAHKLTHIFAGLKYQIAALAAVAKGNFVEAALNAKLWADEVAKAAEDHGDGGLAEKLKANEKLGKAELDRIEKTHAAEEKAEQERYEANQLLIDEAGAAVVGIIGEKIGEMQDWLKAVEGEFGEAILNLLGIPALRLELAMLKKKSEEYEWNNDPDLSDTGPKFGTLKKAMENMGSLGQFGAWRTLGLQARGPLDRLVSAAEKTADNTGDILDNMGEGGLAVE